MFNVVSPESVGLSSDRLQRLSSWLDDQVSGDRVSGASVLVGRHGKAVFFEATGDCDKEHSRAFRKDTVVRIYSMTKPITSVVAMMLYEEGCFQLDDPVAKYIPEFKEVKVWAGEGDIGNVVVCNSPMLVRHIMSHTSGLTYGFMNSNPVDEAYRDNEMGRFEDLSEWVSHLATVPLLCQPGSQWNYSVSTDVLGKLVEIWSDRTLEQFFSERLFEPLGMVDTGFHVKEENHDRFSALYEPLVGPSMGSLKGPDPAERHGLKLREPYNESPYLKPTKHYSGGGGLVSTMNDYARFCQMLMSGGELEGARILSPATIRHMRMNHLPDNKDMAAMGQPVWSETNYDGIGFGLGFAVVMDPVKASIIASPGEHHWGGAASTFFWLDPLEDLYVIFLTQLIPSSTYPIRRELRVRVYQSLVESNSKNSLEY